MPITAQAYSGLPSVLVAISQCESGGMQYYLNGSLVVNPESGAMGMFQLIPYHKKLATKMGLDITTAQGNITYAIWLYNRYGTAPWMASASCWLDKDVGV